MIREHPFRPVLRKMLAPDLKRGDYAVILVDRRAISQFLRIFSDIVPEILRSYFGYSLIDKSMTVRVHGITLFRFYFYYVTDSPEKLYGMRFRGYMLGLGGINPYEEFARVLQTRILDDDTYWSSRQVSETNY